MRLLDASDDDALNVHAWGEGFAEAAWVAAARAWHAMTEDWYARAGVAPWRTPGCTRGCTPGATIDLFAAALWHTGSAAQTVHGGLQVFAGELAFALATVPARLDLATYDPDEALRALLDAALVDAGDLRLPGAPSGMLRGALVAVVHHTLEQPPGTRRGIDRIKAVPLPAVERRAPRGLRVDLFPPWALDDAPTPFRHPGVTLLLGLAPG